MEFLQSKDLFGIERFLSSKKEGKAISERAGLVKYFSESMGRPAQFVGVRMAHLSLDQLYGLQSAHKDRVNRNGDVAAARYWWFITRTTKAPAV